MGDDTPRRSTRIFRVARIAITAISASLFVIVALLWWRSYRVVDYFITTSELDLGMSIEKRNTGITTGRGVMSIVTAWYLIHFDSDRNRSWNTYRPEPSWRTEAVSPNGTYPHDTPEFRWKYLGFGFESVHRKLRRMSPGVKSYMESAYQIEIPYWSLLILLAIAPALQLLRRRRIRYAVQHRLCIGCGYDLRASMDLCPECGRPIETKS